MRHVDSELFEEAYFVMRRNPPAAARSDMVAEAERILMGETGSGACAAHPKGEESKAKTKGTRKHAVLWFFVGAAVAALLFFIL